MKEPEFDEYEIAWAKLLTNNLIDVIIAYMKEHPDDDECDARNIYLWMKEKQKLDVNVPDGADDISEDIQHVGYTPEACGYEK